MSPARARLFTRALRALATVGFVGLVLGAVTARVVWSGESEIAESTAALERGDAYEATVRARRAAGWYAPGAPHVRVAYERLGAIATTAEGLGDRDLALLAWRGIRTAALETRWLVIPHAEDLDRANLAIARIEAAAPRPPGTRTEPPQRIEQRQLAALLRDEAPRTHWVVLLLVSFVAWAGGAAWAVRRSSDAPGAFDVARARAGVLVALLGVALWVLALWRA
ncbi:hypothetical protein [Polyangium spumosum]|uniref:Uncharacterized protein n=1 Tax=Polyangium spumosum TaxID=889282 RepID=A0A6N7Q2G8_9BACT|nr:hypothetical protein [Polyangium spumosum]MRG96805.1 hypothetical protein [Polyangium spumosum]